MTDRETAAAQVRQAAECTSLLRLDDALAAFELAVRESERIAVVTRIRELVWSSRIDRGTRDLIFHMILEGS